MRPIASPHHRAVAVPARAADPAAVAKIHGGIVDCVGCDLRGADLTNTCVKEHDLHGADFTGANATLMCMSFADFTGVSPSWAVARDDIESALKDPGIIHYHGVDKPWLLATTHPAADRWRAALDRTAWAGWRPEPPHETVIDRWAHATLRVARRVRGLQRSGLPT